MSPKINAHSHPKALPFLFLTELWERFGFYIVQGLLVLFLTEYFKFTDNESYSILGLFTALIYISPIVGGYLADQMLGFKTAIVMGGLFLFIGYALLGISTSLNLFYLALAIIIIGNGLFKPNISTLLGKQYPNDSLLRDAGFTIFYIGINLGSFLAGFTSGYLKNLLGWQACFFLASIGMVIGLSIFLRGLKYITYQKAKHSINYLVKFIALSLGIILLLDVLLRMANIADSILRGVGILILIGLFVITLKQDKNAKKKLILLNILIISSVIFWALFFQMFFSMNLFIERLVSKQLLGFEITTTFFYSVEGAFIILLGPLFALMWNFLSRKNYHLDVALKFTLGIGMLGIAFFLLAFSIRFQNAQGLIPAGWVILSYLFITIGELFLSPIGLSAVTLLAPQNLVGMFMGIWFVGTGYGGMFAGILAKWASVPANLQDSVRKLLIYQHAFQNFAYVAFGAAILLVIIRLSLGKHVNYEA